MKILGKIGYGISAILMALMIIWYASALHEADKNMFYYADHYETEESVHHPKEYIYMTGDDCDELIVFDDCIIVTYEDEEIATLYKDGDIYTDGNHEYELRPVQGVQYDSEGHATFEVVGYDNPNMVMLYKVNDTMVSENTNLVLLRLGSTVSEDEVAAYGKR